MAKVREIEVSVGLSIDKNGVWVKGNTKVCVMVDEKDDLKDCFIRAFEVADDALSAKMELYLEDK